MRDSHAFADRPLDELYRWFADETAPTSPTWERLCAFIAESPDLLELLDTLPGQARQPNRFLAAIRFHAGPTEPGPEFIAWVREQWPELRATATTRTTQTNEPGRCAVFAPSLAAFPQPIALLELGASAGLCLRADRYRYRYRLSEPGQPAAAEERVAVPDAAGADDPEFGCAVTGALPGDPAGLVIAARLGVDLNPLSVADPEVRRWLRALVWPDEAPREARLAAALTAAAGDPPELRRADLADAPELLIPRLLAELADRAPGATPVILHSAALAYLTRSRRDALVDVIRDSGAHWLSAEGATVVTPVRDRLDELAPDPGDPHFVVAVDGRPVGRMQPHGRWVAYA